MLIEITDILGCALKSQGFHPSILHSLSPLCLYKMGMLGFPGGAVVKNPPANAGDTDSSPGPGRSHMPRSN